MWCGVGTKQQLSQLTALFGHLKAKTQILHKRSVKWNMMWMLGFGGFKLQAFSHLLTAQERIQYFGNICRFQPSHLRFEERCLEETERVAFWDFGWFWHFVHHPELHAIFFWNIQNEVCDILCHLFEWSFTGFSWILSCLDVQMLNTIPEALLPLDLCDTKVLNHLQEYGSHRLMARSLRHWAGDFWCENLPNTSVLQSVPETWLSRCVAQLPYVSLRKVFFPLGMFHRCVLGQKKSFQQNHGWFAEIFLRPRWCRLSQSRRPPTPLLIGVTDRGVSVGYDVFGEASTDDSPMANL